MKIIGVTVCGTYATWTAWFVASIYNVVDEVIVINGGHKVGNFDAGDDFPLERDLQQLKDIDYQGKILQVRPSWDKAIFNKKGRDEAGRARNIALAFKYAYDKGADWILKGDADVVFTHKLSRSYLEELANSDLANGFVFNQPADWYRDFEHVANPPDDMCNDGCLFFKAHKDAWSVGQGSPVIGDQYHIYDERVRTHHLRRVAPPDVDEYTYHYERLYYHHAGPNAIMELPFNREYGRKMTEQEIQESAKKATEDIMNSTGTPLNQVMGMEGYPRHKAKVVELGPSNYIKMNYPIG